MNRKKFLLAGGHLAGVLLLPAVLKSREVIKQDNVQQQPAPDPIKPEIVAEFIKVAHSDLDRVKALLKEFPLLLNASWDWGGGDFETAIGAAGHMGLKDTANFLLSLGARADIFVLTMLGKTHAVKGVLRLYPNLLNSAGPHGFTLLHHAEKGGKDAVPLLQYFKSQGLTESFIKLS